MNDAQKALLARLRELVVETPKSGALDAGGNPLRISRFAPAVERRADDGPALVEYVRKKIYEAPTSSYTALIAAKRADLTVEALVADADAPWASEFTDVDRLTAHERLGAMQDAHQRDLDAAEARAVEHDRRIVVLANQQRVAKGKAPLTAQQQTEMLERLAAKRAPRD